MISVMEEPGTTCIGTLCQLFHEHGREVVGPEFNLNLIMFTDAIKAGLARFFVARDGDEPVGYAYFNIYRDGMKAHQICADCQAIYVKPAYRGRTSIKLIKTAELVLKSKKIDKIYMHVPYDTNAGKMFTKLGYTFIERTLEKEL